MVDVDSYAQQHGHPPSAAMTVCVDFDKTIIPWGPLNGDRDPFIGVRAALSALHEAHYRIVIFTSRLSIAWWRAEALARGLTPMEFGRQQLVWLAEWLRQHEIPYDELSAEKVPALAYFDDKAVPVRPEDGSLLAAVRRFLRDQR